MKTEGLSEAEINAKHAEKMRRKKEARDKIIGAARLWLSLHGPPGCGMKWSPPGGGIGSNTSERQHRC